jgi:beta-lactamase regulating signal transducer with metallopeptidase domain/Flp pilus assembly protein TadD
MNLSPVLPWSFAAAPQWVELGGFLVRATLIAVLGQLAYAALGRAAASRRHLVAVATLGALVALPVAALLLPGWQLAILPARPEPKPVPVLAASEATPVLAAPVYASVPVRNRRPAAPRWDRAARLARTHEAAATRVVVPPSSSDISTRYAKSTPPAVPRASLAPLRRAVRIPWLTVVLAALFTGTGLVLLGIVAGMTRAGQLARRAEPVLDTASLGVFEWARERMGVRSKVALAQSPVVTVPIVTGILRPVLLLPATSRSWSADRLRIVFLHELAHVRRGDAAALLLGRIATALFWFHPLVWSLARAARRESERACDDLVLASGVRASEYADQLLEIGALGGARDRLAGATLAVARRSSLELRLVSILQADAPRGPVTRLAVAVATLAAALLMIPIVTVRVVAATAHTSRATTTMVTTTSYRTETHVSSHEARVSHESCFISGSEATSCADAKACTKATACGDASPVTQAEAAEAAAADAEAAAVRAAAAVTRAQAAAPFAFAGYKSGDGLYSQARDLYDAKKYADAGDLYRQAALTGYRPATSFYNAACSYALDGQTGPALSALAEARDAGFDNVDLLASDSDLNSIRADHRFHLIQLAITHTDKAEAELRANEAQYRALQEANSKDPGAWKSLGMTLMRSGNSELAADAFGRQYQIDASPSALYNQACAYALDRERVKALDALEKSILAGFGDDRQVAEDADLASLHDDPRFGPLVQLTRDLQLYSNGIDDDDRDSWRGALPRFERVTRERPQVGRAWFNLGFARLKCADIPGSRQAFTRSLELKYRPGTSMYNLACVEAQAKNRDAAMQWLQKAEDAGMEMYTIFNDKDLDPLRSDPRFQSLTARLKGQMTEKKRADKS